MRRISLIIIIAFFAVCICGCEEQEKKPRHFDTNGVQFNDLVPPSEAQKVTDSVNFKIFTFQIPLERYHLIEPAFSGLNKSPLKFHNLKSFTSNGFDCGFGVPDNWVAVGNCLQRAGAKTAKRSTLVIYDELDNDFMIGALSPDSDTVATYFTKDGNSQVVRLAPGMIGWRINSRLAPGRPGVAQVKIQGLYKPMAVNMISRIPKEQAMDLLSKYNTGEIIFNPTSLMLNMAEGDFILLGGRQGVFLPPISEKEVTKDNEKEDSNEEESSDPKIKKQIPDQRLVELFFRTRTNMNMPKKPEEKTAEDADKDTGDEDTVSNEVLYERVMGVEVAEVFLILCTGVGS